MTPAFTFVNFLIIHSHSSSLCLLWYQLARAIPSDQTRDAPASACLRNHLPRGTHPLLFLSSWHDACSDGVALHERRADRGGKTGRARSTESDFGEAMRIPVVKTPSSEFQSQNRFSCQPWEFRPIFRLYSPRTIDACRFIQVDL